MAKISFPVYYEIICLLCSDTLGGKFTHKNINRKRLKQFAKFFGWQLQSNDWICKKCLKKGLTIPCPK